MKKIALIGAGNINWHLGAALPSKHFEIIQVYSKTRKSAQLLAKKLKCKFTTHLDKINVEANIVLIAVSDDVIPKVAKELSYLEDGKRLFIHTSGNTDLKVLDKHFSNHGIFWPPQSIRKEKKIDIQQTPFIIVAKEESTKEVMSFAKKVSKRVSLLNEEQKEQLHLAAVFANNFTNHIFSIAHDICKKHDLDFTLLLPIIQQTIANIEKGNPDDFQTGPAIRGDKKTIQAHQKLLNKNSDVKKIYSLLSKSINPKIK